ncbi:MAG: DNA-binding protein [Candidatus Fluviicola riflensis]|nr:MAG: DNA-binding protein [Candidatus Fluviicola riflensis]OGS79825.1 MAG: DNA-binding protein [Candidatus Fluviicola riflensis]OGS82340.1 MAG: DNA-binding protein [Fluviicola sp. RIFCSPHIGHO2_01_FULL_43_53]OGS88004.1 MAG: DNA-binding protein [Fluviicola sp. RIFCSPHIGHO2_12_FULL_43_24]
MNIQLPDETIYRKIFVIRDQKVMLDNDLAELYQVDTKRLNEQVKRNNERFPDDFMFQLTEYEWDNLKSQFATSSLHGGRRTLPYVFTEHGVLMLSSVLNSKRAIAVNIQIMRVYTRLKEMIQSSKELQERMNSLEEQLYEQDAKISRVFQYVQEMNEEMKEEPRTRVGYK